MKNHDQFHSHLLMNPYLNNHFTFPFETLKLKIKLINIINSLDKIKETIIF